MIIIILAGWIIITQNKQHTLQSESYAQLISTLENKINTLNSEKNENKMENPIDINKQPNSWLSDNEILHMKVTLDLITKKWINPEEIIQNPKNPKNFYYIYRDVNSENIQLIDLNMYPNYLQDENVGIEWNLIISESLWDNKEWRIVDFVGNELVIVETDSDNSWWPCSSAWWYNKNEYYSINMQDWQKVKTPYIIPDDISQKELSRYEACRIALEAELAERENKIQ
jgi:hypothetical protein